MILNRLKQQKFWYIQRNWRMKNQILIIQLVIFVVIFTLVFGIMIISQQIVGQLIQEASDQVFIKQTKQQLNNIWVYKRNFQEVLQFTKQQKQIVNLLYRFVDSTNFQITDPIQCLNKPNTNDSYCYNSSQCYGIFGDATQTSHLKSLFSLTSLLTFLRPEIDNTQALYFSHSDAAKFYTLSKGFYFRSGFQPHRRPWYANHLNQTINSTDITQIVYGNPYQIFSPGGIKVALTSNLLNLNNQVSGVIAKDINFNQIELFQTIDSETVIMILNKIGEVVYSKLYSNINQTIYQITDENYSGFNQTDYEEMQNFQGNKPFISNCKVIQQSDVFCRRNSKYNDCSIILIDEIANTPYQMILLKNTKGIKLQQTIQLNLFIEKFYSISLQNGLIILVLIAFIIFFSSCASQIIFRQLNLLISNTKLTLKEINFINIYLKKLSRKYCIQSQAVTDLYIGVIRLMHHFKSTNKSEFCLAEENKNMPPISNRVKKRLAPIKQIIKEIDNEQAKSGNNRKSWLFLRGFK